MDLGRSEKKSGLINGTGERYLLFKLGDELYGTPLLEVREVVEFQEPKPIPNTVSHYLGVINIRGEIVGVIDLRGRFGLNTQNTGTNTLLVFRCGEATLATMVNMVEAVSHISSDQIDLNPKLMGTIPLKFILGVAKHKDKLVTLIKLSALLSDEEIATMKKQAA